MDEWTKLVSSLPDIVDLAQYLDGPPSNEKVLLDNLLSQRRRHVGIVRVRRDGEAEIHRLQRLLSQRVAESHGHSGHDA